LIIAVEQGVLKLLHGKVQVRLLEKSLICLLDKISEKKVFNTPCCRGSISKKSK
jgi:DNA-binding TFAR19-related protein (PDSD5 family)